MFLWAATHSRLLSIAGAKLWVSGASLGIFDQTLGPLGQTSLDMFDRLRCEHCHREMKNEHSLNVHISRYHNQDCAPVQTICPVCNKTYSNQYSLRTHMHLQAAQHSNILKIIHSSWSHWIRFDWNDFKSNFVHCFALSSTKTNCFYWVRRREVADQGQQPLASIKNIFQPQSEPHPDTNLIILILMKMRSFMKLESHLKMSKILS